MQNNNNIFTIMRVSGIHTIIHAIEILKDMVMLKM